MRGPPLPTGVATFDASRLEIEGVVDTPCRNLKSPPSIAESMFQAVLARSSIESVDDVLEACRVLELRHEVTVQPVDPDIVYNLRHLESAVLHAQRAAAEGRASAHTLGGEFLLYLSGERRMQNALERAGIRPGMERVVLVAIGGMKAAAAIWGTLDRLGWSRDPAGIRDNPKALERLGVASGNGGAELAVLERVALVDVRK